MDDTSLQEIKTKTLASVFFLSVRNFGLQILSFVGFFILSYLLGIGEVGLFGIISESISFFGYFSDLGLAAYLIHQPSVPQDKELKTAFIIQQLLVLVLIISGSIIYYLLASSRGYQVKENVLFASLCLSFIVASFKTIPSILLERKLNFRLLSQVDVLENFLFYLVAIVFALLGFGAYSFAIATIVRSLTGVVYLYHLSPWQIGLSFDRPSALRMLRYGIPFQFNSFIAAFKDRLSSLVVAGIIGREGYGIISWAQKVARVPLNFMDAIIRLTFPTFSRLQDNPSHFLRALEKTCYYLSMFTFPAMVLVFALTPDLINIIPKYQKWAPAIDPLGFYLMSFALATVTTPLINSLNALGKVSTTSTFMIMWTVLTWIFFPLLSQRYGYLGTAIANLIVSSSSIIVWFYFLTKHRFNLFRTVFWPSTISIFVLVINQFLPSFVYKITILPILFVLLFLILQPRQVKWLQKQIPQR